MPPQQKRSREQILDAALELVSQEGAEALNARALAGRLHCSTQPIFSNFATMEELRTQTLEAAQERYRCYLQREIDAGKYPPYKSAGMGYIRFARQERQLFRWLFMRDRTGEDAAPAGEWDRMAEHVGRNTGLAGEKAGQFHLKMWIFVHGIAAMIATGYLDFEEETVSRLLTEVYQGALDELQKGGEPNDGH